MGDIKNASKIDLSNKNLNKIPSYIFECRNLKHLNLSNNKISEIPIELTQLKHLKSLDVSNNKISQVYAKTFMLKNLTSVNLNNNQIRTIPRQIGSLKKLKKLLLAGNLIEKIPEEIETLLGLQVLNISNNRILEFPNSILKLIDLTHLWIGHNLFKQIPTDAILVSLKKLKAFYCYTPSVDAARFSRSNHFLANQRGNAIKILKLMEYQEKPMNNKPMNSIQKPKIFVSYSHKDVAFKNEVETTLLGLKNIFPLLEFDYWIDTKIKSGDEWKIQITEALNTSSIAIFLVSRNFLASEFIMRTEVPTILSNAKSTGTLILNLIVGQCPFKKSVLGKYQAINDPNSPLKSLSDHEQDIVYAKLSDDIENYLRSSQSE